MSLQTPLGKVRGLGAAGNGVHHWWVQRLTSIALVPLAIWLLVSLVSLPSLDFVTLVSWIGGTWTASLLTRVRDHGQLAFAPRNPGGHRRLRP